MPVIMIVFMMILMTVRVGVMLCSVRVMYKII
jgi:hypothetical protein